MRQLAPIIYLDHTIILGDYDDAQARAVAEATLIVTRWGPGVAPLRAIGGTK